LREDLVVLTVLEISVLKFVSTVILGAMAVTAQAQQFWFAPFERDLDHARSSCMIIRGLKGQDAFNDCVHARTLSVAQRLTDGKLAFSATGVTKSKERSTPYIISMTCTGTSSQILIFKNENLIADEKNEDRAQITYRFDGQPPVTSIWRMIEGKAVGSDSLSAKTFMELASLYGSDGVFVEIRTKSHTNSIEFKQMNFHTISKAFLANCAL
jgi:hypothetical protein